MYILHMYKHIHIVHTYLFSLSCSIQMARSTYVRFIYTSINKARGTYSYMGHVAHHKQKVFSGQQVLSCSPSRCWCDGVLQCCNVLHCCSVLQCDAARYSIESYSQPPCSYHSVLQCAAVRCSALQYCTVASPTLHHDVGVIIKALHRTFVLVQICINAAQHRSHHILFESVDAQAQKGVGKRGEVRQRHAHGVFECSKRHLFLHHYGHL